MKKCGIFCKKGGIYKKGNKRIFIPEAIIKLKKSGVKGRHKKSHEDTAKLEAVNAKLGIILECRHAV